MYNTCLPLLTLDEMHSLVAPLHACMPCTVLWAIFKRPLILLLTSRAYLQLAPMSTTTDLNTAIAYSISNDPGMSKKSLIFKIVTKNNVQRGADLQWLSAFPNEAEFLYPPLTYLQPEKKKKTEVVEVGGYTFTVLEVNPFIAA
jgi:hypothetical protein